MFTYEGGVHNILQSYKIYHIRKNLHGVKIHVHKVLFLSEYQLKNCQ